MYYCHETRLRIQVALWAYSYETMSDSLVPDSTYDRVCKEIDLSINTGNTLLDNWFRAYFEPHTGQWIYNHPELTKIEQLYERLTK